MDLYGIGDSASAGPTALPGKPFPANCQPIFASTSHLVAFIEIAFISILSRRLKRIVTQATPA
ncbi:hypothetical protein [Azospirillum endophyticum]